VEKLTSILAVALEPDSAMLVLDKAAAVAARFGAGVEVLVDDSVCAHRVTARCAEKGYRDIKLYSVASVPESGYETAMRRIWSLRPDLVVKAPATDGSDWEFANECPAPVLLVRGGAWEQPARFAAAVDVSDEDNASLARSILHTAGFLALGTHGNLDILYSEREAQDETLRMQRAVRLAQLVREFYVGCERLQIYSGDPAKRLPPLVAARRYDVLVLGGESPGDDPRRTVPATVRNLVAATSGDVVLVKAPSSNQALEGNLASRDRQRAERR
jgi:hypothetical protein